MAFSTLIDTAMKRRSDFRELPGQYGFAMNGRVRGMNSMDWRNSTPKS
jgi:hypothetical protein